MSISQTVIKINNGNHSMQSAMEKPTTQQVHKTCKLNSVIRNFEGRRTILDSEDTSHNTKISLKYGKSLASIEFEEQCAKILSIHKPNEKKAKKHLLKEKTVDWSLSRKLDSTVQTTSPEWIV